MGAGPVHAATQGDLGAASTGTLRITVSVASRALLSGLADVALTSSETAGDLAATQTVCIWTNAATRRYSVTATGSGSNGAFELAGQGDTPASLPFSAQWIASSTDSTGETLVPNQPLAARLPADALAGCPGGHGTARLALAVPGPDGATAGTYAGQLTLLVAPQ